MARHGSPLALALSVLSLIAHAGDGETEPLDALDTFVARGGWKTDLDTAKAEATRRDRPILAYFARRDSCRLCRALERGVLSSAEFRRTAREYVLYLETESAGPELLVAAGAESRPHFAWLDRDGTVLFGHEVARTAGAFAATGARARRFFSLRNKTAAGDAAAARSYALARAALGRLNLIQLQRELAQLGRLDEQQARRMKELRPRLEFERIRNALKGERYFALRRAGFEPTGVDARTEFFFEISRYAEFVADADLYAEALEQLKKMHGGHDHADAFFHQAAETLERLRKKQASRATPRER